LSRKVLSYFHFQKLLNCITLLQCLCSFLHSKRRRIGLLRRKGKDYSRLSLGLFEWKLGLEGSWGWISHLNAKLQFLHKSADSQVRNQISLKIQSNFKLCLRALHPQGTLSHHSFFASCSVISKVMREVRVRDFQDWQIKWSKKSMKYLDHEWIPRNLLIDLGQASLTCNNPQFSFSYRTLKGCQYSNEGPYWSSRGI